MEKSVDDPQKIIEYMAALFNSFPNIDIMPDIDKLRKLYDNGKHGECASEIKRAMRISSALRVIYLGDINKSDPTLIEKAKKTLRAFKESFFQKQKSTSGQKIKLRMKKSQRKALALVGDPSEVPMYGTKQFKRFKINLYVRKYILNNAFETFVYAVAHEFAHVVLYSVRHKLKESDVATDLLVICLGFGDIMKVGREFNSKGRSFSVGYLTNEQFEIACKFLKWLKRK